MKGVLSPSFEQTNPAGHIAGATLPKPGDDKQPVPVRKETVVAFVNGLTVEEQAGIMGA